MKSVVAAPSCTSPILWIPGELEDALGGGRLTRVYVGKDTDISITRDVFLHKLLLRIQCASRW
jgi:hypothetical protein